MRSSPIDLMRLAHWLPALLIAGIIFVFSSTPGKQVAQTFDRLNTSVTQTVAPVLPRAAPKPGPLLSGNVDWLKVGHGVGYFFLGASVLFGLSVYTWRGMLSAQAICSLYAVTDEVRQHFVPGRAASAQDVLLDSLAACAGILILALAAALGRRLRTDKTSSPFYAG